MAKKITIEEIKQKIEFLITSQEIWGPSTDSVKADLSLNYMRKKLKEVLLDVTEYQSYLKEYIEAEIRRILNEDIPRQIGDSNTIMLSTLEKRFSRIEQAISDLKFNNIIFGDILSGLIDGELEIREISGGF